MARKDARVTIPHVAGAVGYQVWAELVEDEHGAPYVTAEGWPDPRMVFWCEIAPGKPPEYSEEARARLDGRPRAPKPAEGGTSGGD